MKDGVYYDMPADEYHALPRLSSSYIKKLLISPTDFWVSSWMNPNRREYESDTFNIGTAYHKRFLEGADAFNASYALAPICDKRTKEGKQIYADWLLINEGKEPIKHDLMDFLGAAESVLPEDIFNGGSPEVSILWTDQDTGVPMKARLDYKTTQKVRDLKTFSNSGGRDIDRLICGHIVSFGYYIQAAVYNEAHMVGFNEQADIEFVFLQTGDAPVYRVVPFSRDLMLFQKGKDDMRRGINMFHKYYTKYSTDMWKDDTTSIALTDESFPLYIYD